MTPITPSHSVATPRVRRRLRGPDTAYMGNRSLDAMALAGGQFGLRPSYERRSYLPTKPGQLQSSGGSHWAISTRWSIPAGPRSAKACPKAISVFPWASRTPATSSPTSARRSHRSPTTNSLRVRRHSAMFQGIDLGDANGPTASRRHRIPRVLQWKQRPFRR